MAEAARRRIGSRAAVGGVLLLAVACAGVVPPAPAPPPPPPLPGPAPPPPPTPIGQDFAEGQAALALGDRPRAQIAFERALALAEAAEDRSDQVRALTGLGDSRDPLRERELVAGYYERALALARGSEQDPLRARLLYASGVGLRSEYRWAEAQEKLEQALALAQAAGDSRLERRVRVALGHVFLLQGRWDPAEAQYQAVLALHGPEELTTALVIATESLGDVADGRGDLGRAAASFGRAVELARRLGNANLLIEALTSLAGIHLDRGDYARAHGVLLEALAAEAGNRDQQGDVLNQLGLVAALEGDADLAAEYYRRARTIAEELGERYLEARVINNEAVLRLQAGDHAAALAAFERALALSLEVGDGEAVAGHWRNLGIVHQAEGRLPDARVAYERSLALAREGDFREEVAEGLETLGDLELEEGEAQAALARADEAAVLAAEIGNPELFWHCRALAGRALSALGRTAEARAALQEAVLAIEQVRRQLPGGLRLQGFLATRLAPYRDLVALEMRAGNARAALAAAEAGRARMLLDLLPRGREVEGGWAEDEEREAPLREELVRRNRERFLARQRGETEPAALAALEAEVERARLALRAFHADLDARRPVPPLVPSTLADPAAGDGPEEVADRGSLILVFAVADRRTQLFTLAANAADGGIALRATEIPAGKEELHRRVEDLNGRLARRDLDFDAAARGLYELLLAPVEGELSSGPRLVIVPDGPLWNLPFQALKDGAGRYLLERHTVSYAPSLAVLRALRRRHAAPEAGRAAESVSGPGAASLLAIGNPALAPLPDRLARATRRSRPLGPLPEAAAEVRELARLYSTGDRRVLTGAAATEREVKAQMGRFRVLHFATHGVLEDPNPLYSHLVLAQDLPPGGETGEDGLLEAWEVLELRLAAELVVLSACHSGQGTLGEGEGLVGLTWAFLAAGSRAVVASQWEVDSAAARALMLAFHRRLRAGQPAADALRLASRELAGRQAWRHPFYWAGFVLVGDGAGEIGP